MHVVLSYMTEHVAHSPITKLPRRRDPGANYGVVGVPMRVKDEAARAQGSTKSKSRVGGRKGGVSIDVYSKLILIDTGGRRHSGVGV